MAHVLCGQMSACPPVRNFDPEARELRLDPAHVYLPTRALAVVSRDTASMEKWVAQSIVVSSGVADADLNQPMGALVSKILGPRGRVRRASYDEDAVASGYMDVGGPADA